VTYRLGSLFSGIGGLELGFEMTGEFETVFQVEIDPWARGVLARHWPAARRFDDVRNVGKHNLPECDVLVGGFPCQPHSIAGKRAGTSDERWLWPEFARLIGELRPRVAVMENVPGLLTSGLDRVLGDLAESGYDAEWDCLPAAAVGAPHGRDRLFIVAYPQGARLAVGQGRGGRAAGQPGPERRCLAGGRPSSWWSVEPPVCRLVDGFRGRVDEIRGVGNAVVPQVAYSVACGVLASGVLGESLVEVAA
jgi:DNA (cytosine-5)-methyltransferase 1